jgi:prepilin-type N-terminal cleavage/methylation domain-containing protein/prepilin-type processing-associated H-X9-DG protein
MEMRKIIVSWLRRTRRAFTLIELLVVIAIIGILAGMLLPALTKAREKANNARSVSNEHQWGLAMNMYNDDWTEYYPYDGSPESPCAQVNTDAWFNVLPPYMGQKTLCQLYSLGQFPTPRESSVWVDPSATNKSVNPNMASPVFYYAMTACLHEQGSTQVGFRRDRMTSPSTTFVFCEEPEDNYSETQGAADTVTRHSGGSNFFFGDGHVEWVTFGLFCRQNNPNNCPYPLNQVPWADSSVNGDWNAGIPYHWWPFLDANTSVN